GDDLGERAHPGAVGGMAGEQRRLGMRLVEILDDGERLEKDLPVILERRHQPLRIDREIGGRALGVAAQVDRALLGLEALQIESDAHAKRGRGAEVTIELHGEEPRWWPSELTAAAARTKPPRRRRLTPSRHRGGSGRARSTRRAP